MRAADHSVLHVLPHAGGGGDTYVDLLNSMPGYRIKRVYLAPSRMSGPAAVARGLAVVARRARAHDVVHVHGEMAGALLLPLIVARPSVVTLHGLHLLRRVTGVRRRAAELNLRAVVRAADKTICVSNAEHHLLLTIVGRATSGTVVVHNGTRVASPASADERHRVRSELGLARSDVVGIWVGSLDERRDPLAVVRAAERASTPLIVAGDGPLLAEVKQAAPEHVRVLGHRDDIPRLLDAADFFVLMSHREGLSFALLEAMAHGLPAIVADVAENVEAVGDSGISVPYADEAAIATALRRLAEGADQRMTLGERARQRVTEYFSLDGMIARTRAVYDDVLGESGVLSA